MTNIKTLADFKRLPVGTKMVLRSASDFGGRPHRLLGVERVIDIKQTNAIRFSGGSWLYYPSAKGFSVDGDYIVITSDDGSFLAYEVIN